MSRWQDALAAAQNRRAIWAGVFGLNAAGVVVWGLTGLKHPWALIVAAGFVLPSIIAIWVLLARNRELADAKVMALLDAAPVQLSSAMIADATGLGSGSLYPALARLEHSGRIVSWWADEPKPRRRFYRISMSPEG